MVCVVNFDVKSLTLPILVFLWFMNYPITPTGSVSVINQDLISRFNVLVVRCSSITQD